MGIDGLISRDRSEGVDVYCLQEIPIGVDGSWYGVEGYVVIGGVGGIGGGYDGRRERGAVVGMMVKKKWEKKMVVLERKREKIGVRLRIGGGKELEVWSIYVGQGKHLGYEWVRGIGNVVVMGDINARSERWEREGVRSEWEGKIVERWMDEWGFRVGTRSREVTRVSSREGERDGILDVGFGVGDVKMEGRVWEGIVGMDHRAVEMEVEIEGIERWEEEEEGNGMVDWEEVGGKIAMYKGWGVWKEKLEGGGRKELEEVVEGLEGWLCEEVKASSGKRKWRSSKKRWWNEEIEEGYERVREKEREWELDKSEEKREDRDRERKRFKRRVYERKGSMWGDYLERVGINEAFKWVKMDRDFVLDVPGIRGENGEIVEGDEEKGEAIVRGLGKREELEQEEEGEE